MSSEPQKIKPRRLAGLRASFLTGLAVVLPTGLTIYFIWTAIGWIDSWVLPLLPAHLRPDAIIDHYFGTEAIFPLRGVGVIVFLVFTISIGWIAKGFFGRSLITWGEKLVGKMPIVRSLYKGLKQITETLFSQDGTNFENACLFEYPKPGVWALGFVTTSAKGEIKTVLEERGLEKLVSIFLPTTPNPTSGYLLYVPESQIIYLDMKIEDTAKLIISAGLVYPQTKGQEPP